MSEQRDTSNPGTKEQIEKLGRKASIYTADLASKQSVSELVSTVIHDGHDINILLNCAGIQRRHPSHVFPDEDWDEVSLLSPYVVKLVQCAQRTNGNCCDRYFK